MNFDSRSQPSVDGSGRAGIQLLWKQARSRSLLFAMIYAPAWLAIQVDALFASTENLPSRRILNRLIVVYELCAALLYLALPRSRRRVSGGHIAHLSLSQIEADIRIEKYVRILTEAKIPTHVIGATTQAPPRASFRHFGADYMMVFCNTRAFTTLWRVEHVVAAVDDAASVLHANDLSSLLPALVAGRLTGARVIYDAHEVWSQNVDFDAATGRHVPYSRTKRFLLHSLERYLSRRADLFVTVNKPIADYYREQFALESEPMVVRNVPLLAMVPEHARLDLKAKLGLSPDRFLLGYIGGVGPSRNIETVIEAVGLVRDPRLAFFVMGPKLSVYEKEYRALAVKCGCEERLFFHDGVPMSEVPAYMGGLDAGILMLKNLCMNFYLFLPNKIFEYMAAEIPVLSSDFPVVSELINQNKLGVTFDPESPPKIAEAIESLMSAGQKEREAMGQRGRNLIFDSLHWERESASYVRSVRNLIA